MPVATANNVRANISDISIYTLDWEIMPPKLLYVLDNTSAETISLTEKDSDAPASAVKYAPDMGRYTPNILLIHDTLYTLHIEISSLSTWSKADKIDV